MRRWLAPSSALGAALLFGVSCGGAGVSSPLPGGTAGIQVGTAGGARLVVVERATPGWVQLSVWIDAGARDADPPQVATLAAWLAEERAGGGARARVYPDGTSVELLCPGAHLSACANRLAHALATRGLEPTDADRLRRRLVAARRRALADEGRLADALALRALLGDREGLDPLGSAEGDGGATAEAVRSFLAAHYGPRRAMVVAAGEVRPEALREAVADALADAPAATAPRDVRSLGSRSESDLRVTVGDATHVSVAAAAPDLASAAGHAHRLAGRLGTDGHALAVHAFPLRGGAIVLARLGGTGPTEAVEGVGWELGLSLVEGAPSRAPSLSEDPVEATRQLGSGWIAEGPPGAGTDALGVGVVVAGGRADAPTDEPDASTRRAATAATRDAVARVRQWLRPATRGAVERGRASIVLDNGARLEVRRRREAGTVAVAVRFGGGAASDPPTLHGRAALAATLTATACAGLEPAGLTGRLSELSARVTPLVEAGSWGIVLEAPSETWRESLDLALRCALRPSRARPHLERARVALLERLRLAGPEASWAAGALAPHAPGAVAPLGTAETVRDLGPAAMSRIVRESMAGARVSVAVVGAVPVRETVGWVARRLAHLPAGATASVPTPGPPVPLAAVRFAGTRPRVVVGWRIDRAQPETAAIGARAFAAAVAETVSREGGLSVVWLDGSAGPWGAWAAVALDADEDALDALRERLGRATARLGSGALSEALARAGRARDLGRARASTAASTLAARRLSGVAGRGSGGAAQLGAALADTSPAAFAVGRPAPR